MYVRDFLRANVKSARRFHAHKQAVAFAEIVCISRLADVTFWPMCAYFMLKSLRMSYSGSTKGYRASSLLPSLLPRIYVVACHKAVSLEIASREMFWEPEISTYVLYVLHTTHKKGKKSWFKTCYVTNGTRSQPMPLKNRCDALRKRGASCYYCCC